MADVSYFLTSCLGSTRLANSFKSTLDWSWNGWASAQSDLMLVVCGSAASWVIDNLLEDHGGFYNRVTRRIQLRPFTLGECEQLLRSNGVAFTRQQVIKSYMVFGGIPHYLNLIDRSDGVINICEAKFSESPFVIDSAYEEHLLNKIEAFEREAQPQKALHLTMVTSRGVARNAHHGIVINEVTGDDLFAG